VSVSSLAKAILKEGTDDWVPLLAVAGLAKQLGAVDEVDVVDQSLGALGELVDRGLVELGSVSDEGFLAWPEAPPVTLARVEATWRASTAGEWEFCCWVNNTDNGDREADVGHVGDVDG
jgi:hypothetical protein